MSLKEVKFGGIALQIPEIWTVITESYTEPDGRECAMIEISAGGRSTLDRYQLRANAGRIRCFDGSRGNI